MFVKEAPDTDLTTDSDKTSTDPDSKSHSLYPQHFISAGTLQRLSYLCGENSSPGVGVTRPISSVPLLYNNEVVVGGYIGFTLSVRPSVRPSVPRPSRIPCPLCSFYSSGWIHFIFMHLIKQLQKVCLVQSFLQNFKFWQFFKICNFDFVLFWLRIWCESLVWVIMGRRGVSQNAGVLVMMTSSNGNIFRVTGHLCGEFTGPRWIPHTKASDAELWCLLWSASGKSVE